MNTATRSARRQALRSSAIALILLLGVLAPLNAAPILWSSAAGGNDHFYEFVDAGDVISWHEARIAAESAGGYLVSITTFDENDFVASITAGVESYIGATDEAVEGVFEWLSGEPFVYTNWAFQEPNDDIAPASPFGEDYTIINPPGNPLGTWNDLPDNSLRVTAYVVEFDARPVPEPSTLLLMCGALAAFAVHRRRQAS